MTTRKIDFLIISQVLFIHDQMVKRFGGSHGIRDIGLIQSAVARPQATFGGKYLYSSIFDKTAALLQSLLKNHAFLDGNKRTALTSAGLFLWKNGYRLVNNHKEEVDFTIRVDNGNLTIEQISKWLKEHSGKITK
ncbi:MAG: type II toxin-antitoxin system death-on-curing family toxin [Candidatus Daviesbacteria bacterium]|nr:type II toxin-antitoxin system death-on-curing family toxin [Candidatus Daviesbacteria bacterium]